MQKRLSTAFDRYRVVPVTASFAFNLAVTAMKQRWRTLVVDLTPFK